MMGEEAEQDFSARDMEDFDEFERDVCGNCGGEGWIADCFEEWACVDPESGCELCMERCDWCNRRKPPASCDGRPKAGDALAAPLATSAVGAEGDDAPNPNQDPPHDQQD